VVFPGNHLFLLPALGLSIFELYSSTLGVASIAGILQADMRDVLEFQVLRFEMCSFRGVIVL
jgi:hypothetical protein